ncbi:aspartyl protease [Ceratobasidium sp. AG-Ba]|nr:aspartyl protease [Ceratobasidium sp. AG-Ba]
MRLSLVAVALVSASPVLSRPASKSIAVSLRKRGLPSGTDGVADPNRLSAEMFRIQKKYGRGNGGIVEKRETGTVPLTDQDNDLLWTGSMTFGGQELSIDFDTGSSDLWVPASDCSTCGTHKSYDPAKSQTSEQQSGNFSIEYGDGSTASGSIYTDTVGLGETTITKQIFSAVNKESGQLQSSPNDGICGLGYPSISQTNSPNIVENAFNQGQTGARASVFYLNKAGSQLVIGGSNPPQCQSSFKCAAVTKQAYWQFDGVLQGPSALPLAPAEYKGSMIADTGTTLMVGDPMMVGIFCKTIGAVLCTDPTDCGILPIASQYYQMPCEKVPNLTFSIPSGTFTIPSQNLIFGTLKSNKNQCVLGIAGSAAAVEIGAWIMGDTLLKSLRWD